MLKTQIFANKVSNLTDARYFAAWGADWLCFNLYPGEEESVSAEELYAIKEWVAGPKLVGAFGMMEEEDIRKGIELLGLDGILLGNFATVDAAGAFSDIERIKLVVIDGDSSAQDVRSLFENWQDHTDFFLLDFSRNGYAWENLKEGESPISANFVKSLCEQYPVLLAIDCKEQDVEGLLDASIKGLVFHGGAEESVGVKSFDVIDVILEVLAED